AAEPKVNRQLKGDDLQAIGPESSFEKIISVIVLRSSRPAWATQQGHLYKKKLQKLINFLKKKKKKKKRIKTVNKLLRAWLEGGRRHVQAHAGLRGSLGHLGSVNRAAHTCNPSTSAANPSRNFPELETRNPLPPLPGKSRRGRSQARKRRYDQKRLKDPGGPRKRKRKTHLTPPPQPVPEKAQSISDETGNKELDSGSKTPRGSQLEAAQRPKASGSIVCNTGQPPCSAPGMSQAPGPLGAGAGHLQSFGRVLQTLCPPSPKGAQRNSFPPKNSFVKASLRRATSPTLPKGSEPSPSPPPLTLEGREVPRDLQMIRPSQPPKASHKLLSSGDSPASGTQVPETAQRLGGRGCSSSDSPASASFSTDGVSPYWTEGNEDNTGARGSLKKKKKKAEP
uniref:Uncharacterized protein n=1 Tax=Callithrix jacchus TaxID=9483 RepID=A0A8I3WC94_CALJA